MALLRYVEKNKDDLPFHVCFDICLTGGSKGVFDDEAASLGANLFYLDYRRDNLPNFIREFRSILASGCYNAIHDHQDYTAGIHFLMGIGHLPPVRISHIHNPLLHLDSYCTTYSRRLTTRAGKYLLSTMATHVLGTSRQIVSEYGFDEAGFTNVKRDVVHCGFDVADFNGNYESFHEEVCQEFRWDRAVKIILFVGRLNSNLNQKNPYFALEVAKACIEKDPDIRFLMAGGGEDAKIELENKVKLWGLQDSIRIIGSRSDIPRLMSGSNLLLFPSIGEGLGMVAVEAQAAGLRVLASNAVPKECEVIPGIVTFKSLDTGPLDWAKEALRLLSLPRPSNSECNEAIRRSPFSIEQSASSLLNIYALK
jgi:glycosyltransferase involved in cell wall biosynthesis